MVYEKFKNVVLHLSSRQNFTVSKTRNRTWMVLKFPDTGLVFILTAFAISSIIIL